MNRNRLWIHCGNSTNVSPGTLLNNSSGSAEYLEVHLHSDNALLGVLCGTFQDFHSTYCCYCTYIPNQSY